MTTALALITRAFREGNLIPIGSSPSTYEQAEGLAILNSYMLSQFANNVGDKLAEWPVPATQRTAATARNYPLLPGSDASLVPTYNTLVPPNSRVIWDGSDQTIYLDPAPQDGAMIATALGSGKVAANIGSLTIDGNGRLIGAVDNVTVTKAAFVPSRWFYRADTAAWTSIVALASGDAMIFPDEFDDLWVCGTSVRLAPRYGKTIAEATIARGGEMLQLLKTRYFQTQVTGSGGDELRPGDESFGPSGSGWMQ